MPDPDEPTTPTTSGAKSGFSVPDNDPPYGATAMAFTAGAAALIGLILILLALLGDCLQSLLGFLGVTLVGVAIVGWSWSRAAAARYNRRLERLRRELEE